MLPGFVWNGRRSESWGLYLRSKKIGLLPATRDIEVVIPGRPGIYDYRTEHDKRTISIDLYAEAPDRATLLQNLRALALAVDPTLGYASLIFDDEPGREYRVKVTGTSDVQFGPTWALFTLGLKMADPFIYDTTQTVQVQTVTTGAAFAVQNDGGAPTPVVIRIAPSVGGAAGSAASSIGQVNNSSFDATTDAVPILNPRVAINGQMVAWLGQVPSGEELVIDTGEMSVLLAGQNALSGWSGDFPLLVPGPNDVTYQDDSGGAVQLTLGFLRRWT